MNMPEDKRLSQEDWNKLDDLLSKHGFGGYYDLLECLKMAIQKFSDVDTSKIKSLPQAVLVLLNIK